jgi:vacuolar-type H+-ATPase subunit E/Vma4
MKEKPMNKANILTFRLPGDVYKELSQRAETEGYTISDLARRIITEHARVQEVSRALDDIAKKNAVEHAKLQEILKRLADGLTPIKSSKKDSEEIEKILLHVSWLVEASPHASKRRREHGFK